MSSYKKDHALHNEKACAFLNSKGDYPDWVVTTAFYSALHFVQDEVFPTTIGTKTFVNFENYYNGHYINSENKPSRHKSTINLLHAHIDKEAGVIYKWLHDACRTARYRNFKTHPDIAKESIDRLAELKTYLTK